MGGRSIWLEGAGLVAEIILQQQQGLVVRPVLEGSGLLG